MFDSTELWTARNQTVALISSLCYVQSRREEVLGVKGVCCQDMLHGAWLGMEAFWLGILIHWICFATWQITRLIMKAPQSATTKSPYLVQYQMLLVR